MTDNTAGADSTAPLRIGILGAGMIATTPYGVLPNMAKLADKAELVAIADPVTELAKDASRTFGIPEVYDGVDAMLAQSDIDAVVNLTPIGVHGETSRKIVDAGKHLATEKPLATTMEDADAIIESAASQGLTIVCSPPDALFPTYAEAARLIAEGAIGKVAFAKVRSSHAGPGGGAGGWPTDPTWFYQAGSGPLLDMGVYGIHEITALLGPAQRVVAFAGITEPTRVVRGGPFAGKEIEVTADDNNLFMLDFGGSTFAVVDGTFNVQAARSPKIEIFGRKGTMNLGTGRDAAIELFRVDVLPGMDGWIEAASGGLKRREEQVQGLGRAILVDHLVDCVRSRTQPVLSAEHARHALEIMLKVTESARTGRALELTTSF
ncbi:MAG TPA: Gfo/Idh/MocA family oxidoreductase [Actinopolymorphaceae bacterium]